MAKPPAVAAPLINSSFGQKPESRGGCEVIAEENDSQKARYNAAYLIPCLTLALALIAAGLFPDLINTWLSSAAHELLNSQTDYTGLILKVGGGL